MADRYIRKACREPSPYQGMHASAGKSGEQDLGSSLICRSLDYRRHSAQGNPGVGHMAQVSFAGMHRQVQS